MGMFDFFKGFGGAKFPDPQGAAPISRNELAPISGVSSAQMGFMGGSDGNGKSLTWARYSVPYFTSGYGPWAGAPGSEVSRERAVVSAVSQDMLSSNTVVATLVEQLSVAAIGSGLKLSAKPLAAALGITSAQARELSHEIEEKWGLWSGNPFECDASHRNTVHELATASFKSWLLTGESVVLLDWRKGGSQTATKVHLIDSRQIDQSITRVDEAGSAIQGVQFDKLGRAVGYFIRPFVLGSFSYAPMPVYVPARTSWGRARVLHIFDLLGAGQIRGLSPLTASLSPAKSKETLQEFALAGAYVQQMMAATIESNLPTRQALGTFQVNDGLQGISDTNSMADWAKSRGEYYGEGGARVRIEPGVVSHLAQGDSLKLHRSETPNSTYDSFHKALLRESAKASGASYEELSGDFSLTSFSASRLALDMPNRISERRRRVIAIKFYASVYAAWLEEQIETKAIQLPDGAKEFWQAKDAYCNAVWRGKGKANSDPLKAAQANVLLIQNGLATYDEVLGDDGKDFEEVLEQRQHERQMLEAAGLPYPIPKELVGEDIDTSADDDEALK
jgi:lambda family phage portal protein